MNREEKNEMIATIEEMLNNNNNFYLADISELDAESTTKLRRLAHKREVSLNVVKNTLLRKALENAEGNYDEFYEILKGNTSIMFAEIGNAPAKLIKEFRKTSDRPILKGDILIIYSDIFFDKRISLSFALNCAPLQTIQPFGMESGDNADSLVLPVHGIMVPTGLAFAAFIRL